MSLFTAAKGVAPVVARALSIVLSKSALGFAAAISIALAGPVAAADLKISHQWQAETDARDRAARVFVAEVAKRSAATRVAIHAASSMKIEPEQQYDAMLDGRIEMTVLPLFYLSRRMPEFSITLLPGVPATSAQAQSLKGSDFHKRLQAFCESKGFRILTWWWLTGGMVMSTDEAIATPDDLKGHNVRGGDPLFDAMFESVGGVPQTMPSTRIAEHLKSTKLSLAVVSLESMTTLKLFEGAKSAVVGGPALYVAFQPLVISTKAWAALSDAERKAFEAAAEVADAAFVASQRTVEADTTATLSKAGVTVRAMPYDDYEAWIKIANETSWAKYRAQSETSSTLFMSMLGSLMAK